MTDTHEAITVVEVEKQIEKRPDQRDRMHPLAELAIKMGPDLDVETLRQAFELQKDYQALAAKNLYTEDMIQLKASLNTVIRHDKKAQHFTYLSLAGIVHAVGSMLATHGFSLSWKPDTSDPKNIVITAILTHRAGHSETSTLSAPPDFGNQKIGRSATDAMLCTVTKLERYTAMAVLGLASSEQSLDHPDRSESYDPDAVDTKKNMKAAAHIRKRFGGITAAEEFVGRPVSEWTGRDLEELRQWVAEQSEKGD